MNDFRLYSCLSSWKFVMRMFVCRIFLEKTTRLELLKGIIVVCFRFMFESINNEHNALQTEKIMSSKREYQIAYSFFLFVNEKFVGFWYFLFQKNYDAVYLS